MLLYTTFDGKMCYFFYLFEHFHGWEACSWVGKAYRKLTNGQYDDFRKRLFQKTGLLMTADGSDDHKIMPEGLSDYKIPPPSYVEPDNALPVTNNIVAVDDDYNHDSDNADDNGDEEVEHVEEEEVEKCDDERDRTLEDELVGRELTGLYENGWFVGKVLYLNTALNEYKVLFDDGSFDYITIEDINGIELKLL